MPRSRFRRYSSPGLSRSGRHTAPAALAAASALTLQTWEDCVIDALARVNEVPWMIDSVHTCSPLLQDLEGHLPQPNTLIAARPSEAPVRELRRLWACGLSTSPSCCCSCPWPHRPCPHQDIDRLQRLVRHDDERGLGAGPLSRLVRLRIVARGHGSTLHAVRRGPEREAPPAGVGIGAVGAALRPCAYEPMVSLRRGGSTGTDRPDGAQDK